MTMLLVMLSAWGLGHPAVATCGGLLAVGGLLLTWAGRRPPTLLAPPVSHAPHDNRIGDYVIVNPLAEGTFARVYTVRHARSGQTGAAKVLKSENLDGDGLARFLHEMDAGRGFQHPALIPVAAYGDIDGAPYLVTESMAGETLESRLRHGPLDCDEALRVTRDIVAGLIHLHALGVLHRDLKPANVLLTADGGARLLDSGVARCLNMRRLTVGGSAHGTPAYMSPEHAHDRVDVRSDIYSLGALMFVMLTGHPPYDADDPVAMVMAHVARPVPRLRDERPGIAPELDALVAQMLSKTPDQRPQTVEQVQAALAALVR